MVEETLPDVINMDRLSLKTLMDFILAKEKHFNINNMPDIAPVNLPATLVLTRRIIDTQSLVKLLKVCSNPESEWRAKAWRSCSAVQASDNFIEESLDLINEIELSSKQQKHAVLRQIQNMGELLTGKNLLHS